MIQPFWRYIYYISTSKSRCLSLLIPGWTSWMYNVAEDPSVATVCTTQWNKSKLDILDNGCLMMIVCRLWTSACRCSWRWRRRARRCRCQTTRRCWACSPSSAAPAAPPPSTTSPCPGARWTPTGDPRHHSLTTQQPATSSHPSQAINSHSSHPCS